MRLHYDQIINNITTSPLSYFLAFIGAFIWAAYCTVTNKYARGFNGITVFVLLNGSKSVGLLFSYATTRNGI